MAATNTAKTGGCIAMSKSVGQNKPRVDAYDKASGRAKYTGDLCGRNALTARLVHSQTAHGMVTAIDTAAAEKVPGVVKIFTCFDVPQRYFPTAGHPWSTDPGHQDIADRLLLTRHVRFFGDDVAVVVAEDEIAAAQAAKLVKVSYDEYPFVLDVQEAMRPDAPSSMKNTLATSWPIPNCALATMRPPSGSRA